MTDLLETLRALAPVVTPGEWTLGRVIGGNVDIDGLDAPIAWQALARFVVETEAVNGFERSSEGEANATAIVTLRNAIPAIIAALETVAMIRDEDWLAERISDSLDMDWRPIDAARAIIAGLEKEVGDA